MGDCGILDVPCPRPSAGFHLPLIQLAITVVSDRSSVLCSRYALVIKRAGYIKNGYNDM